MLTLVVAEIVEKNARKTTLSAITFAREVSSSTSGNFDILAIGEGANEAAAQLTGFGARKVITSEISGGYICERYAPTVAQIAKQGGYNVIVATASTFGKDLMPRTAAKLGAGIASDIAAVTAQGGKLSYRRPMFAGNVFGTVEITTPTQVVSVRQSEFEAAQASGGASPIESVAPTAPDAASERVTFVSLEAAKSERPELTEAAVVVSGGRAFKSAENFKALLEPLADALGAAIGASRAACDAGYVSNEAQVGQTGKVVAPKLYIAIGISGAIQHLAGMKSSKVIVAINKDKEIPLAQLADYFLVADLFKAVPALTEEIKKLKAQS